MRRESREQQGRAEAWLQYLMFRGAFGLVAVLPLPIALRVGEGVALLVHLVNRPHRRIALTNLRIAFPERSARAHLRILRRFWLNIGRMVAETAHMRELTPETVASRVTFEDPDRWRAIVAKHAGRGVLVLTGHFGNWELLAYAHGLYGLPVHLVYRALKNPLIDEYLGRLRRSAGTVTVRKRTAGANVVRAMRQGAILVIPADQNSTRRQGVFVDFFGFPASTNRGLARLAVRSGLPVYPAFLVREGRSHRHKIVIGDEVAVQRTGDRSADLQENTQRFARVLEEMIRRHPDHWVWIHRRWKTRPLGAPAVY